MDVDAPSVLKRCSSAPLINEGVAGSVVSAASSGTGVSAQSRSPIAFNMFSNNNQQRIRRFSASFSPLVQSQPLLNLSVDPQSAFMPRLAPRVNQLRKEECADVCNTREVAHEREVHTAIQMGQSCEDLTLVTPGTSSSPSPMSPTRHRFSPAVSPSPKRGSFTTRRSLSPIAIRASCLSPVSRLSLLGPIKRRIDDGDSPSSKRMCDRLTPSTPGTPDSDSSIDCTFRPVSPRAPTLPPFARDDTHAHDVNTS